MTTHAVDYLARGRVDREGRLLEAGEPLAALQLACGGSLGGPLAIPELRAIAAKATGFGLRLSRPFAALGDEERVTGWVDAMPADGGCELAIASWHAEPIAQSEEEAQLARVRRELNRALPEFSARLDQRQGVLTVEASAPDLGDLAADMIKGIGRPWTDFVTVTGSMHDQPLHWRLLDGAACRVAGSQRDWTAWLEPLGMPEPGSTGFVLTLVSDQAVPSPPAGEADAGSGVPSLGEELAPVLRQPLGRVIAHAESIRAKLAGPLPDIYAGYAGDMVDAGEHLLALIEDIADLEGVEASEFEVAFERIDLGEAARQAAAILGARAQERDIVLAPPPQGESQWARGEFRRVLQVLINVIGNAIAYSPEESQVWIRLDREGRRALVTVADQGRGLSPAEQARVFDKFERLGRSGDGGSGLGLYISARLARAMEGDLTVESAPGQGARFTLALPALD
jgi:anti-sigma regulatory factor (Ser/Thr protein kinase)